LRVVAAEPSDVPHSCVIRARLLSATAFMKAFTAASGVGSACAINRLGSVATHAVASARTTF